jgi:SulP family sulfate permease
VQYFKDQLEDFVNEKGADLKLIIIDGESINTIDSSGIYMFNDVISKYHNQQIEIALTGMKGPVRDILEKSGIMKKISYENCFMSIQEAVDAFEDKEKNKELELKYFEYIQQTNN